MGFKSFVSQGDTLDFEFPPDCGLLGLGWGRRFMAGLCPSLLHLLPRGLLSLVCPVGGPQFSEEVLPHEAVNPLCPQKEQSPPPAMPSP